MSKAKKEDNLESKTEDALVIQVTESDPNYGILKPAEGRKKDAAAKKKFKEALEISKDVVVKSSTVYDQKGIVMMGKGLIPGRFNGKLFKNGVMKMFGKKINEIDVMEEQYKQYVLSRDDVENSYNATESNQRDLLDIRKSDIDLRGKYSTRKEELSVDLGKIVKQMDLLSTQKNSLDPDSDSYDSDVVSYDKQIIELEEEKMNVSKDLRITSLHLNGLTEKTELFETLFRQGRQNLIGLERTLEVSEKNVILMEAVIGQAKKTYAMHKGIAEHIGSYAMAQHSLNKVLSLNNTLTEISGPMIELYSNATLINSDVKRHALQSIQAYAKSNKKAQEGMYLIGSDINMNIYDACKELGVDPDTVTLDDVAKANKLKLAALHPDVNKSSEDDLAHDRLRVEYATKLAEGYLSKTVTNTKKLM